MTSVRCRTREGADNVCMRRGTPNSTMQEKDGKAPVPRWCPPGLSKTQ
jgi:hypothetical protein